MKIIELIAYMKNLGFTNIQSINFIENELQKEKVNTKPFHLVMNQFFKKPLI